jgi:hypothetical protein
MGQFLLGPVHLELPAIPKAILGSRGVEERSSYPCRHSLEREAVHQLYQFPNPPTQFQDDGVADTGMLAIESLEVLLR